MDWQEILSVRQSLRRFLGNCGAVACHQQIQQVSPQLRFLGSLVLPVNSESGRIRRRRAVLCRVAVTVSFASMHELLILVTLADFGCIQKGSLPRAPRASLARRLPVGNRAGGSTPAPASLGHYGCQLPCRLFQMPIAIRAEIRHARIGRRSPPRRPRPSRRSVARHSSSRGRTLRRWPTSESTATGRCADRRSPEVGGGREVIRVWRDCAPTDDLSDPQLTREAAEVAALVRGRVTNRFAGA